MCGFCGFIAPDNENVSASILEKMTSTLVHRGPDDQGLWIEKENGVALGHQRLSIVDLSSEGHQPMVSSTGRYVIAFNGEIYNFQSIRSELEQNHQIKWHGHSDTEVLLAAIETWGIENALKRSVGMFAFALWDKQGKSLTLARDRLGEKPLYYGWQGKNFLFGSELKSLRAHPDFRAEIDRDVLALFMRFNYIPAPWSIYQGIKKLPPGTYLTIPADHQDISSVEPHEYWSFDKVAFEGINNRFVGSEQDAIKQLEVLLEQSLTDQMVADVPLGAFLSGGYDSSLVVALMQKLSSDPVKTFTIGFDEQGYNEAEHAKAVAKHLGTDHTEFYVRPDEAMAVIPDLPHLYDEPFSDSSQIPTFLVSKLARKSVTVSLSGDGGDELFGGYNRYMMGESLWKRLRPIPLVIRELLSRSVTSVSPATYDRLTLMFGRFGLSELASGRAGDKLHKLADVITSKTSDDLYLKLLSHWSQPQDLVLNSREPNLQIKKTHEFDHFIHKMMSSDTTGYLPGDILTKVDRASMGVSLESRIPLLDHRIVEFAWRLPLSMKVRDGKGKWILRQVLYKHVPQKLLDRPKMGFGIPIDQWLRGPLREWAEDLLSKEKLKREGYLNPEPIRRKWQEHLSGRRNWQYHLWDILIFQQWLDHTKR